MYSKTILLFSNSMVKGSNTTNFSFFKTFRFSKVPRDFKQTNIFHPKNYVYDEHMCMVIFCQVFSEYHVRKMFRDEPFSPVHTVQQFMNYLFLTSLLLLCFFFLLNDIPKGRAEYQG